MPEMIPLTDEAARVNVALVDDSEFPDLTSDAHPLKAIGAGWKRVAVFPTAEMLGRLDFTPRLRRSYTLYRRNVAKP